MIQPNFFAQTVLLLQNCAQSRSTTKSWLENKGFNVCETDSVSEAIDTMIDFTLDTRPSLILMNYSEVSDVFMDKMRFLQELSTSEDVPLIAVTESKEKISNNKTGIKTIENLEALQPLMTNILAKAYAQAA